VYSFGVMLWEIVTGLVPTRGGLTDVTVPDECPAEIADLIQARRSMCCPRFCMGVRRVHCSPPLSVATGDCKLTYRRVLFSPCVSLASTAGDCDVRKDVSLSAAVF